MGAYGHNHIEYNLTPSVEKQVYIPEQTKKQLSHLDPRTRKVYYDFVQKFGYTPIVSGYRSPKHNARVGGARRSQHVHRKAIDFAGANKWKGKERTERLKFLAEHEYVGGIGSYSSGALHFDTRKRGKTPKIWGSDYTHATAPADLRAVVSGLNQTGSNSTKNNYAGIPIGRRVMNDLQKDFNLTRAQSSAFIGNLAHENKNFTDFQEDKPLIPGSRGGAGYAMWTGSRRRDFERYARNRGLALNSYDANYGFLKHELENTSEGQVLKNLRNSKSVEEATLIVSKEYFRPGIPHNDRRIDLAKGYYENTDNASNSYTTVEETFNVPPSQWTVEEEAIAKNTGKVPTRTRTRKVKILQVADGQDRAINTKEAYIQAVREQARRDLLNTSTSSPVLSTNQRNQTMIANSLKNNSNNLFKAFSADSTPGEIQVI